MIATRAVSDGSCLFARWLTASGVGLLILGFGGCVSVKETYVAQEPPTDSKGYASIRVAKAQGMAKWVRIVAVDDRRGHRKFVGKEVMPSWSDSTKLLFPAGSHSVDLLNYWKNRWGYVPPVYGIGSTDFSEVRIVYTFQPDHDYVVQSFECITDDRITEKGISVQVPGTVDTGEALSEAAKGTGDFMLETLGAGLAPYLFLPAAVLLVFEQNSPSDNVIAYSAPKLRITERYLWMTDETTGQVVWGQAPSLRD